MHSAVNSVGMRIRERRYEWEGPAVAAVLAVGSHRNEKKSRRGHDIKKTLQQQNVCTCADAPYSFRPRHHIRYEKTKRKSRVNDLYNVKGPTGWLQSKDLDSFCSGQGPSHMNLISLFSIAGIRYTFANAQRCCFQGCPRYIIFKRQHLRCCS